MDFPMTPVRVVFAGSVSHETTNAAMGLPIPNIKEIQEQVAFVVSDALNHVTWLITRTP